MCCPVCAYAGEFEPPHTSSALWRPNASVGGDPPRGMGFPVSMIKRAREKDRPDAPWVEAVWFRNTFPFFVVDCTRPFAPAHERQGAGCSPRVEIR